jgi:hypothetical protein
LKSSTKRYYFIIAILFVISVVSWVIISFFEFKNPVIEIYKDGDLYREINLTTELFYTLSVGTPETGINLVNIKDGWVWVGYEFTNCPNHICFYTGRTRGLTPIICVPNRLEIRIVNGENPLELDAVAR